MYDPELSAKISVWRQKCNAGTITDAEMQEAVAAMRAGRLTAAAQPTKSKSTKGPAKSADSMLGELDGL